MFRELHKVKDEIIDGMFTFLLKQLKRDNPSAFKNTALLLSYVNKCLIGNLSSGTVGVR